MQRLDQSQQTEVSRIQFSRALTNIEECVGVIQMRVLVYYVDGEPIGELWPDGKRYLKNNLIKGE